MITLEEKVKPAQDELEDLQSRSAFTFQKALLRYARASLEGNALALAEAEDVLMKLISQTMTLADLLGRKRLLREADALRDREQPGVAGIYSFADRRKTHLTPVVPDVPFEEAVADILSREPRLADKASRINEIYRRKHGFALGKKTTLEITKKIRDVVASAIREGDTEITTGKVVANLGGWAKAYGRTVYRTNLATAYAAGRMAEARDPDVAEVIGAFEFQTARDISVRPNHRAAQGFIAAVNDPIWNVLSPPLGFNCRCALRLVDRFELSRKGLLRGGRILQHKPSSFKSASADAGFGVKRADWRIYA